MSKHSLRFTQFLLAFFIISVFLESNTLVHFPQNNSVWYMLFEFVSAYANVGISMVGVCAAPAVFWWLLSALMLFSLFTDYSWYNWRVCVYVYECMCMNVCVHVCV